MSEKGLDKVQAKLSRAIKKDAPCTFDEPIPVLVSLDNGIDYKGEAYAAVEENENFPDGLIMVRTTSADLGVPISYIQAR